MAFTFLVEDGTGLSGATSYVSVSEADDIIYINMHATETWSELTTTEKEGLLSWASRYIDERTRWYGYRVSETSGLRWPRSGVVDQDGIAIASNVIPKQLRVAVAEMARYLMEGDRSQERDQDGLVRLKADVIELEFSEGYRLPKVPSQLAYMLKGLGAVSTGSGIQFKRIIR